MDSEGEKAFSTMFPTSCTLEQINASAVDQ